MPLGVRAYVSHLRNVGVAIVVAATSACGGGMFGSGAARLVPGAIAHGHAASPIQHVVVIMQENRSFDNFFHDFPGAHGATSGMGHGVKYPLQPVDLQFPQDPIHSHWEFLEDLDGGKNDGFDREIYAFAGGQDCKADPQNHPKCWVWHQQSVWEKMAYSYVKQAQIKPYWDMAKQYTLGDNTFSSNNGPTFVSHQYMVAGQSGHSSEVPTTMPWGCDAPKELVYYLQYGSSKPPDFPPAVGNEQWGPDPCFPLDDKPSSAYPTIADSLDAAGVTWRYYVQPHYKKGQPQDSYWLNAFDAVKAIRYGPDWTKDISTPDTKVLTDIANGKLQQVSWVMPHGGASDHAGGGSGNCGPNWVTSIVDAIGQSQYWNNTAIIIMWDEWGGWYDHVIPKQYPDPRTGVYEGLGYRVPLIVVSPYAKAGYISHKQHEVASTLHYIEQTFGLPFLGTGSGYQYADQRADAFDDIFDYTQKPIAFTKIKSLPLRCKDAQYFLSRQWPEEIDY
ncbi:MAG TPA: alkaline phosphatase family protein [Candidatus Tumulicola sp.]|jgi:phospholipase C